MKIETKYDQHQELWLMKDNQPIKIIASEVDIYIDSYYLDYQTHNRKKVEYSNGQGITVSEDKAFPTKEELLESL